MEPYTINEMTNGHKDAIDLFDKTLRRSNDPHIREFAKITLRTLQHHLEMAKHLNENASIALEIP
jgi:predicted outer membrane protein